MWLEDRWIFVRRMCGDEFTQKLFMRCITWTLMNNDIKGQALQVRQDAVVGHLFRDDPKTWFRRYTQDTWMTRWDAQCQGYVSQRTLQEISKKVNILGPIAGVFGRDLEMELTTQQGRSDVIPSRVIEYSIANRNRTLKMSFLKNRLHGP